MTSQTNPNALLHRRDVVNELVRARGDLLVIAGLGAPNWDVSAAGDHANNFPLWGAMGAAAMIGLGLALAQPKRKVLVITGDGEMLMSLGSLATIARRSAAESDHRGARQRALRRDRHAEDPHRSRRRPRGDGGRGRHSHLAHGPDHGRSHRTARPRP